MVQLKVYTDNTKSEGYYIDLYEENPIKLNFSIEDITSAEAKSVFSRSFRVPASGKNNLFFKFAFLIEDTDFDVTVKKPAELYVNGVIFRQGHIRLQKIYNNKVQNRYEYELIFLGETRDFASALGDASLCALDLSALNHVLTTDNVRDSWRAYPSNKAWDGVAITPSFTEGLKDGQVLYPLIDHGDANPPSNDDPTISLTGSHNFTNNDLPLTRFKPMVRAKSVVDAIFDQTEYSIESGGFFDTDEFKQIYVSAFGNTSQLEINTNESSNSFQATLVGVQSGTGVLDFNNEIDPGNNFNLSAGVYTVNTAGLYEFDGETLFYGDVESFGQGIGTIILQVKYNGTSTWVDDTTGDSGSVGLLTVNNGGKNYNVGDELRLFVEEAGPSGGRTENNLFQTIKAPGEVNVAAQFDCDYKQIDFIKDLLTTFRLVMAPRRDDPKVFIIESWGDYIASGEIYDWSNKIDLNTDMIIEPLFDTQQDIIFFDHEPDEDYINKYHVDAYKYTYGHLEFDSSNELLVGQRQIKTNWAPTPITQIDGGGTTNSFIIPKLKVYDTVDDENGTPITIGLPIKAKTRLLYYNGLQTASRDWRLEGSTSTIGLYPLVSNSSVWPMSNSGKVLNWFNDVGYWGGSVAGFPRNLGASMYNEYWNSYITSLYNKDARRVSATFILDDQDLRNFSFDDIIFLNGHYYQPEKIIDASVGQLGKVKVQLIKLLNYNRPLVGGEGLGLDPTPTPTAVDPTPTPTPTATPEPTIDGGGGGPLPTPTPTPTPTFEGGGLPES